MKRSLLRRVEKSCSVVDDIADTSDLGNSIQLPELSATSPGRWLDPDEEEAQTVDDDVDIGVSPA